MSTIRFLPRAELQHLLNCLERAGYRCIGPRVRDGAIVFDELSHVDELPRGVGDEQSPGHYCLDVSDSRRLFAWANGPQAIKPQLFAPREMLWRAERGESGRIEFREVAAQTVPVAIIGARPCDVAALAIQDRVFLGDRYRDPFYGQRREGLFVVAVNCSHPSQSCFCHSTGTGPSVDPAHQGHVDLVLTELEHGYLVSAGSEAGQKVFDCLPLVEAVDQQFYEAGQQRLAAERAQTRSLPEGDIAKTLMANLDHPRWQEVAGRCLACGNCTMVCPTCFCHREGDEPALDGGATEHVRQWDSCFTQGHSAIHGFVLRQETAQRYRQWLTHKLASWHEQFGSSGCVGCGRCLTWCPSAIDMTEEVAAICGGGDE